MRTLIIPDIHNHTEHADHWLATLPHDRVVFLGDYFDNFGDDVNDARRTAMWLRDRMEKAEDVFLLGNHDASYMFPREPRLYCPGFTPAKARGIDEILRPEHWKRLRLAHAEQGWLMSHAGFHPVWIKEPTSEWILQRGEEVVRQAWRHVVDPMLGAGVDRGGGQNFGGPLWMDWGSLEPIPGIHQIVGHTPGDGVRRKTKPKSRNYCLDVRNASVAAMLVDGKVEILERV
jgi:Calcineurin-like phosphoesterase